MNLDIAPGDSMADVLAAVQESTEPDLTLRIRDESSLFLTANEFRALSLAAERGNVSLVIESADPLRRQLAALFKLELQDPAEMPVPEEEELEELEGGFESNLLKVDDPGYAPQDTDEQPAQVNGDVPADAQDDEDFVPDDDVEDDTAEPVSRRRFGWKRVLAVAAAAALVAAVLFVYWWFFATATVELALTRQPVTTNMEFTVASNSVEPASADSLLVDSRPVSFNLTISADAPATGNQSLGETNATGTVVLRNPTIDELEIPEGTTFTGFNGISYMFSERVVVPAVLPDGTAGETTATVAAVDAGATGNSDIGMLSGQLDNGVYYSNRTEAVGGGSDRTVTVVTESDLEQARQKAMDIMESMATTSELAGGLRVVPSSLMVANDESTFSHEAGEEATEVSIEMEATFEAIAFPTDSLKSTAKVALSGQVPEGYVLVEDSVTIEVPVETGSANGARSMIVPVSGVYERLLTEDDENEMARMIERQSEQDSLEMIESIEYVDRATVSFDPSWLPHRMPGDGDRIEIETE